MNSSISTGDRRWTSGKRGGMTVLGKVAVPKPLNLPSQRLENHGLDPNVEIVPKGTMSWGSRPSSGSNPWISSSMSPNADGSASSPSHLSGRPSSGGSITRPSTSGSDKPHETVANAWASNSRPSSSSGALSSNHIPPVSLRPRSAENRPTSSHLSRFAESVPENSMAWGSSTAGKMGVKTTKEDGFTLSSGDFPNLGSEKDNLEKNIESADHGRPRSASRGIAQAKEVAIQADVKLGTVNTWSLDGSSRLEDDEHPDTWKRQGNPGQFFNANASGQVFDARHGPRMNAPPFMWYEGHPRGPAVSNTQGGFPAEAFSYYHHQIRPSPLLGPQPVPPGAVPRGPHPKGGDLFRPPVSDGYAYPNMPFRPGFFSIPPGPMAFEGHYRLPMGYGNNEQGIPYMGIAGPVYNGFGTPGAEIGGAHGRPSGHGAFVKASSEHTGPNFLVQNQASNRVPVRNHEFDQREEENQSYNSQYNISNPGRDLPCTTFRKNEWGAEEEEVTFVNKTPPNENVEHIYSADGEKRKIQESASTVKIVADGAYMSEGISTLSSGTPQKPLVNQSDSFFGAGMKSPALIHKIDCLNAKLRVSEGRSDSSGVHEEEERNVSQLAERRHFYRDNSLANHGEKDTIDPKTTRPTAVLSRRSYHVKQIGVDDHQQSRPLSIESLNAVTAKKIDSASGAHPHGPNVGEDDGNMVIKSLESDGDWIETYDSTDIQAQRAKMRELAKQRATQLQKQEEERMGEQKAKALAKLEELDRRTLASDSASQKVEALQATGDNKDEKQESNEIGESDNINAKFPQPGKYQILSNDVKNPAEEMVESVRNLSVNVLKTSPVRLEASSVQLLKEVHDGNSKLGASQSTDGGISKHQREMENKSFSKSFNDNAATADADKDGSAAVTVDGLSPENVSDETKLSVPNVSRISKSLVSSSTHQRRKSNRNSKNKHKLVEAPTNPFLSEPIHSKDPESIENAESKNPASDSENHLLTVNKPDKELQLPQEISSAVPCEEPHHKVSSQWKPHQSRRFTRGQLGNRFVDKHHGSDNVVWAPVQTQTKAKSNIEAKPKSAEDSTNSTMGDSHSVAQNTPKSAEDSTNSTKGDSHIVAQNTSKGKRAEMERYVPKPVALELAQQGVIQPQPQPQPQPQTQTLSSISSSRSIEDGYDPDRGPVKLKRDNGRWRQRGSVDDPSKGQQSEEPAQVAKDLDPSGDENDVFSSKNSSVRDQVPVNRGKMHIQRSSGSEFDGPPDTEKGNFSRDFKNISRERTTHWQPKNQLNSAASDQSSKLPRKDHRHVNVKWRVAQESEAKRAL